MSRQQMERPPNGWCFYLLMVSSDEELEERTPVSGRFGTANALAEAGFEEA